MIVWSVACFATIELQSNARAISNAAASVIASENCGHSITRVTKRLTEESKIQTAKRPLSADSYSQQLCLLMLSCPSRF